MELPLGEGTIDADVPGTVTVAEPPGGTPVDVRKAAGGALASPAGPRLATLAGDAEDAALVVTDVTRAPPDEVLVDLFVAELAAAGVDPDAVTVVVGL
ncbi:MAG: lactate racemase domain-containing protein, partial [Halobacteriales archaeon]